MKIPLKILRPLLYIISALISQASEKIHLELSTNECLPGDLVELTATSVTPTYQDFTLSIPKNKNLQFIAKEASPATLKNNQYSQIQTWIFQAIAPGKHQLANITARTTSNNQQLELQPLSLTVLAYDSLDQGLTPASYPVNTPEKTPNSIYYYFLFIIPAFLCLYIIRTNKFKSSQPEKTTPPISVDTLKRELTKEEIPEQLCFQLLEHPPNSLTEKQKKLIEQALYQPNFSATDLLNSLKKEDLS